jgi:shikimate kinase
MIALVGLPGSGKSTIGRQLARRLGEAFVDSDHVIEQRLGCSIREYFEREGEECFRDVEESVIDDLTLNHEGVLATGGGAVLREANRVHLRTRAQVSTSARVLKRSFADSVMTSIGHCSRSRIRWVV